VTVPSGVTAVSRKVRGPDEPRGRRNLASTVPNASVVPVNRLAASVPPLRRSRRTALPRSGLPVLELVAMMRAAAGELTA